MTWIDDAVNELISWGTPNDREGYAAVLKKHQPQCETCAHWQLREGYLADGSDFGECTSENSPWSDCNDYTILTVYNFGCIFWEKNDGTR